MRIATFGSCLSRYTANSFVKLYGGEIVSSVYHNRSDAFVGKFIEKNWIIEDYASVKNLLKNDTQFENIDQKSSQILKNQYPEWMGLHRLSKGMPFFTALDTQHIDLMIVDNYMDLSAKLAHPALDNRKSGVFLRLSDFKFAENSTWQTGDYLPPQRGAKCMQKILKFFLRKIPNCKIIFINFPYNTYEMYPKRILRTKEYEKFFECDHTFIIPCMNVHSLFQTKEKQHFKTQQYCGYAGMIGGYINSNTPYKPHTPATDNQNQYTHTTNNERNNISGNPTEKSTYSIKFNGTNNHLFFEENVQLKDVEIFFSGSNATVKFCKGSIIRGNFFIGDSCNIYIGDYSNFNKPSEVHVDNKRSIHIGKSCLFENVKFQTSDPHSVINLDSNERTNPPADIAISDNVLIEENVHIYKGVNIGSGSIICAHSVVTKSIPEHCMATGFPVEILERNVTWNKKRI